MATLEQMARLLMAEFQHTASWQTWDAAYAEVLEVFGEGRVCLVARVVDQVAGWIGGIEQYDGNVYELHPLVVAAEGQGRGVGRQLVAAFEDEVRRRGAQTITLGTDDEDNRTSLSGVDLYPQVWRYVEQIENRGRHPYEFYQKLGYVIVGVIPDANGWGKPDILMAKRVGIQKETK